MYNVCEPKMSFRKICILTLALTHFLSPTQAFAKAETFHVTLIKVNKSYYANGQAFYRARCNVENNTERAGSFYVQLLGLSESDQALHSVQLTGTIDAYGKRTLRDKNQMDSKTYKKINRWIVGEADFD